MNKELYYIPDITEFCVGFECEMKNSSDKKYFDWEYCVFNDDFSCQLNEDYCFEYLWGDLKQENIRVKYLDAEDIKSIGFREDSLKYFKKSAPGHLGYWTQVVIDFRWGYDDISIRGARGNEEDILFRGTIKNKTELKRILTQIKAI